MRFIWVSNYTAQSSYAIQARLVVPRLAALGHRVDVLEVGGGGNTPRLVDRVQILPVFGADPVGNDCVCDYVARLRADAVLTLYDQFAARGELLANLNWWAWTPVDHMPLPPIVDKQVQHARGVIAMSRFGLRMLAGSRL
ncbi:MAG: hypothetical protein KatS3mg038_1010 [Candidatus Kapaibacterium sp.]|nr:MAG: hypothetical protein KatS3mg038_1010 [Candidatus Kapabacteria bacterium]